MNRIKAPSEKTHEMKFRESTIQMLAQIIPILTDTQNQRVLTQVINASFNAYYWKQSPRGLQTLKIILPNITSQPIISWLFKVINIKLLNKLPEYEHQKWLDMLQLIGPLLTYEQLSIVLKPLKDKFLNHISPYVRASAFKSLAALVTNFTSKQRKSAFKKVIANLDDTLINEGVISALTALIPQSSTKQVSLIFKKLLKKSHDPAILAFKIQASLAIFTRLNKKQRAFAIKDWAANLNNQSFMIRSRTLDALPKIITILSTKQIASLVEPILSNLIHKESYLSNSALSAFSVIVLKLPLEQILTLYETILDRLLIAELISEIDILMRSLFALSPRLSQEQSLMILEQLIVKLNEEEGLISTAVSDTFTAISLNLSLSQIEDLFRRLTDRLNDGDLEIVSNNLTALAAILIQLTPHQVSSVLNQALSLLDSHDRSVCKSALKLLMVGAPLFSFEQVETSLPKLIIRLEAKEDSVRGLALQILNIMIPKLDPMQRELVFKKGAARFTDCKFEVCEQATALVSSIIVSEKNSLPQLKQYSKKLSKSLPLQIITECYTQIKAVQSEPQDSQRFSDGIRFFNSRSKSSSSLGNQPQTTISKGI